MERTNLHKRIRALGLTREKRVGVILAGPDIPSFRGHAYVEEGSMIA